MLLQEEGEVIIKVYKGTLIKIIIMMSTETSFIIKTLQYSLKKVGMVHFDFHDDFKTCRNIQSSEMRPFVSVCRYTGKAAAPCRIGSAKNTSEDFVKTQSGLIFSYKIFINCNPWSLLLDCNIAQVK